MIFLLSGCASFRDELSAAGGKEEAIKNAISDFSRTTRLYKTDTFFSVSFKEVFYEIEDQQIDKHNSKGVEGKRYPNISTVRISGTRPVIVLGENAKIGSIGGAIPTRVLEKSGKLFYWDDDNYPLTDEAIAIYKKYNVISKDPYDVFDMVINDAKKGVHYYFCRDNLLNYKKVVTNVGLGYYTPPMINCKGKH